MSSSSFLLTPVVLSGFMDNSVMGCLMSKSLTSEDNLGLFDRGERELECDDERCELLCDVGDFLSSSCFLSLDFLRSLDRDDDDLEDDLLRELLSFDDFDSPLRRRGSRSDSRCLSDSRDLD